VNYGSQGVSRIKQRYAELYALGWTYDQMAEALGVTARCLYKWRWVLKLPRRPRGPRKE
jgi:hypothetical protein